MSFEKQARQAGARVRAAAAQAPGALDGVLAAARGRRRRALVVAVVALLVLGIGLGRVVGEDGHRVELAPADEVSDLPTDATQRCPVRRVPEKRVRGWRQYPAPPVGGHTVQDAAALSDTNLVVVTDNAHENAALLDVVSGQWTCLPDSPLRVSETGAIYAEPVGGRVAVWNDSMITAYDPQSRSWRDAVPMPAGKETVAAVAAGDRLLVWRLSTDQQSTPGAAWEPETGRWAPIPDAPMGVSAASAVWNGRHAYLIGTNYDGNARLLDAPMEAAAYDPRSDSWEVMPSAPLTPESFGAGWVGGRLIAWDYQLGIYAFEQGRWNPLPLPFTLGDCVGATTAAAEDILLSSACGQAAMWKAGVNAWEVVRVPRQVGNVGGALKVGSRIAFIRATTVNYSAARTWVYDPAWE